MATALAKEIGTSVEKFEQVAARHSEDTITRDTSGSLGGVMAGELLRTPEILDALAEMRAGDISRVVETHCGFHVLYRHPVPPETMVSGARIVIGHDGTEWLRRFGARRSIPSRSRSEALELVGELYDRARLHPDQFSELVREYSEHRDAIDGGDLGEWSTRESSHLPREIEILARLRDGEVAPPIESLFGFEILLRTPHRPRKRFAVEALQIVFDAEVPEGEPMSKRQAWNTMSEAAATLSIDPSAWSRLHSVYGTEQLVTWSQGRATGELDALLEDLEPGEIAPRAVEWASSFVIAKAVSPTSVSPTHTRYELPSPVTPDTGYLAHRMLAGTMQKVVLATVSEMNATRTLSTEQRDAIQGLARTEHYSEAEASAATSPVFSQLKEQLGVERFGEFERTFAHYLEGEALSMAGTLKLKPTM